MIVLSLFDGMSCGRLALQRANIPVLVYYASEIDKYAIQVAQKNFPDTIQLGDVTKWQDWELDWSKISMILAGSPCQSFSSSGNGSGFEGKSGIIEYYFQILEHVKKLNPDVKFLLENVKMKKEWENVITKRVGVEPVFINSALLSAQNRQRLYWCNWQVSQPEDKHISLSGILEDGFVDRNKAYCIDANYWKGTNIEQYLTKKRRQIVFKPAAMVGRRLNAEGKREDYNYKIPIKQYIEVSSSNKSRCLSTVQKDTLIALAEEGRYSPNEVAFRKLTVTECERLQTLPDGYTEGVSNTQRYKMIGNGWTVDVIAHILRQLKEL